MYSNLDWDVKTQIIISRSLGKHWFTHEDENMFFICLEFYYYEFEILQFLDILFS